MSQVDLKYATILIKDGYSGAVGAKVGAVNHSGGYAAAAVTMVTDGFASAVTTGDFITVVGSVDGNGSARLTRHQITSHTESTGATISITISPGLSAAVLDNAVITVQPNQLEVKIGTGTLTYSEKRNIDYVLDRGLLDTVREGDQAPVEVKLDFTWEFLRSDTAEPPTVEEALKNIGNASTWLSSSDDDCEPYAVDLEVIYDPICSGIKDEVVLLSDFRWEQLDHNYKDGQVSVSGKCNVSLATVTRE